MRPEVVEERLGLGLALRQEYTETQERAEQQHGKAAIADCAKEKRDGSAERWHLLMKHVGVAMWPDASEPRMMSISWLTSCEMVLPSHLGWKRCLGGQE